MRFARDTVNTRVQNTALEEIRFASSVAAVGSLRCGVDTCYFRGEQVTSNFLVAFPDAPLWIRQDRGRSFVASSTVATIYNRGQRFERHPIDPRGDTATWFALSEDVVRDLVAEWDPAAASDDAPLSGTHVPVSPALFRRQRAALRQLNTSASTDADPTHADGVQTEELVIDIFRRVLLAGREEAHGAAWSTTPRRHDRHRDLAERARSVIAATYTENLGLHELAKRCDTSVFHLCRTFRAETGQTLSEYRRDLRLRASVDALPSHTGRLSTLALELGFSSHAHFTAAFRRHFGSSPAQLTASIRANG